MDNLSSSTSAKGTVLVVDDDPITLEISRVRLESAGYTVRIQEGSLGTSSTVLSLKPDVVLLDLNMPGLSGESLSEFIQQRMPNEAVQIIFHSSQDLSVLQEKAKNAGVLGAISKTGNDALFIAQFDRLFNRSRRGGTA